MNKMGGRESVAEEVARVRGLASQLQILLRQNSPRGASELSEELLQALTTALSVLNPDKDELFSFQRPAATMLNSSSSYTIKRENKERNCQGSQLQSSRNPISSRNSCSRRIELTSSPCYDGHEWRKYGQKDIRGTNFPRCYYKCTYADEQKCPATKQVQQKNWNDPPMFEVSYDKQHTCKSKFIPPKLAMDEGILNTTQDQFSFSSYSIPTRIYESTSNEYGHTGYPDLGRAVSPDSEGQQASDRCAVSPDSEGTPDSEGQQALDRCPVSPDSEGQQALDSYMEFLRALL